MCIPFTTALNATPGVLGNGTGKPGLPAIRQAGLGQGFKVKELPWWQEKKEENHENIKTTIHFNADCRFRPVISGFRVLNHAEQIRGRECRSPAFME
jgi:hypothetical protein